ncbi:protein AF1q isoform X1 [Nycticebus coucang]|uniref:protein AF1q isoform X1 n=1 Tax=Nycticebus coucang TaxID=9470 RepID=UPI00234CC0D5|nr:protein AF1q isoform X1 [Nycticebus coucang]
MRAATAERAALPTAAASRALWTPPPHPHPQHPARLCLARRRGGQPGEPSLQCYLLFFGIEAARRQWLESRADPGAPEALLPSLEHASNSLIAGSYEGPCE